MRLSFGVYILVYIFTFTCHLGYTDTLTKNRASVSNGQELFPHLPGMCPVGPQLVREAYLDVV